ncbi:PQQ-binding-like beta-propeller repeat protein [Mucilaginibacter sp.]|uniref:outer membrane protein assembly factor BamB family protein n=1 Tax=Mucilaginibacter sp. TaxID=1882438 RepID=UPI0025DCFE1A|nr:PQQ-binding-like beta-propeller repeat protein [Mucilaginibacter sp.]
MLKYSHVFFIAVLFCLSCGKRQAPKQSTNTNTDVPNDQHTSVLTQHNNNTRAGWNNHETKLSTANVNSQQFGRLFTLTVDDQVYAQPLVAGNITIAGGTHNVAYIATVNNSVYAYDGDSGKLYWQKNFTQQGMRAPKNTDMTGACGGSYQDFSGNIGIVGTPVIDSAAQTIYFVARSTDGAAFVQYLHAVNILTGDEQTGSPVKITATYTGNGDGNVANVLTFDAQRQNQRQALTLLNGVVYVTFSSHCDWGPYHGWILGYNSKTLSRDIVYNDTPNGGDGGIWESGMGMAADDQGNLYAVIGNGTVGEGSNQSALINRGESALKLTPNGSTLKVSSFFTPFNFQTLEDNDLDYGSMGAFLIPGSNFYLTGCKDGNLYLVNKDNMGGFNAASNQVQQTIALNPSANMHCQPAYFKGANGEFAFIWAENDQLRAFPFLRTSNLMDVGKQVTSAVSGPTGQSGAVLSVSSNGSTAGTGILWASYASSGDAEHDVSPGILRAFDASDITKELWSNSQNPGQDYAGNYAKFSSPTIVNGHVYLPTFSNKVVVYGLK